MNILILFCLIFSPIHGLNLTPIVNLTSGPIQGKVAEYESIGVYQFLGVPYAKPPVDKLRLQLPVKPDPWTEVKPTTDFGPSCSQPHMMPDSTKKASEDCLYLNIYVKESTFNNSSDKQRPVLFWIHGGAFSIGSGNEDTGGIPMVPLHDVVLVTINYRLNAFGFMYFGTDEPRIPPNIGLKDQLFALKWVHENIEKFGGDPSSVTIFGQSAGSISTSAHLLSPLSKGLFKRVIFESGTLYSEDHATDTLITNSWKLYNKTSCSKSKDVLECMQNLTAEEILNNMDNKPVPFSFIVGDDFLPYEPSKVLAEGLYDNSIDLLLGVEKNEASMFMKEIDPIAFNPFAPRPITYSEATIFLERIFQSKSIDYFRELYIGPETNNSDYLRANLERAFSDFKWVCPTYMFGHQYASNLGTQGGKVYAYYHTQRPASTPPFMSAWMGTGHGAEIPFVFGLPLIKSDSEKDVSLSREMMKIWTHFAENGETPMLGETEWKPFQENMSAMVLNMDDWGKTETERIEFCLREWAHLHTHD